MFTAAKLFSALRSLLRLFVRRPSKSTNQNETPADVIMTATPQRNEKMTTGFDMQTEIAKLADRIVEHGE
jgi:hypothetical protein